MIIRVKEIGRSSLVEIPDQIAAKIDSLQMELDEMLSNHTGPIYCYEEKDPAQGISYGVDEFVRWLKEEHPEEQNKIYIIAKYIEPMTPAELKRFKTHRRKPIIYI